ncbi:MAG TPA: hypothetical protein VGF69_25895 [Thermoanaerobaculia bacterium]
MSRRLVVHGVAAGVFLLVAIWLSSGTMAPYAATVTEPLILEPCHYLVNGDHPHHLAVLEMVRGAEPSRWQFSVVLRRVLYPVLSWPLTAATGELWGGLLTTMLITAAAIALFALFVRKRWGENAAIATLWLLVTWPGITYWSGLPYGYATIVPGSLVIAVLLYRLDEAGDMRTVVTSASLIGLIYLAYDLFPFFAPAVALLPALRRRWMHAVIAGVLQLVPLAAVLTVFHLTMLPVVNSNTATYGTIVRAWFAGPYGAGWLAYMADLPRVFLAVFLFSGFLVLPLLFLATVWRVRLGRPELLILGATAAVFLFNNAAPPYYGWQLRGDWIPRLYQPVFVAFLLCIARAQLPKAATLIAVAANVVILLAPVTLNRPALRLYEVFYRHGDPDAFLRNLEVHGRRPLGFCREEHVHNPPRPPYDRPSFVFRPPLDGGG